MEPPEAVFEPAAADFAARSLFSDVALSGLFPAAEIAHEVDGGDDGVSLLLGDRAAYVPLLAVCVRSEMLPFDPPQPLCSSGPRNAAMSGQSSAMRRRYSSRVTR